MAAYKLIDVIPVRNQLGESALWQAASQTLWWTDIQARALWRWHLPTRKTLCTPAPERLSAFAFTPRSDTLLAAFESGIALWRPDSGDITWRLRPTFPAHGMRFNDGHTDRQGRFWSGTMTEFDHPVRAENYPRAGTLYCLHPDGHTTTHSEALTITNAICASPDGKRFYFADSIRRVIFVCDFDSAHGTLSHQRVFARIQGPAQPDGAVMDAQGCLWNAQWDGGAVVRYAPDGSVMTKLKLPVSRPTSLAFGGKKNRFLFVTSARDGLPEDVLMRQPMAGNVLVYETDVSGTIDAEFAESEP